MNRIPKLVRIEIDADVKSPCLIQDSRRLRIREGRNALGALAAQFAVLSVPASTSLCEVERTEIALEVELFNSTVFAAFTAYHAT